MAEAVTTGPGPVRIRPARARRTPLRLTRRSRRGRTALLLTVLLSLLNPAQAVSQTWAPWLKREERPEPVYPEITATSRWLNGRAGDPGIVIVDARDRHAYETGHLPGSISIPARELPEVLTEEDLPGLLSALGEAGLSGQRTIVCYGSTTWSADAGRLFWLLELSGAGRVMFLDGGLEGWRVDGGATISDLVSLEPCRWNAEPEPGRLASLDDVRVSYGRDGTEIIDARGNYAWLGPTRSEQWDDPPRVGHVPHALPFDFTIFLKPDGSLREPEENREEFARLGPRPANPVDLGSEFIVYGEGSATDGVLGYFLLRRAGIDRVRWYPGGWKEWSGDPALPIVRIVPAEELMWRFQRSRRLFDSDAPSRGFAFFDVRHPADYARGHINGSVSLRSDYFADSLDARLSRYWPELDRSTAPIVTYCYGEYCIRSRATSTAAARAGFVRVERFYGGLDEWRSSGGTLVRSEWPPGGE